MPSLGEASLVQSGHLAGKQSQRPLCTPRLPAASLPPFRRMENVVPMQPQTTCTSRHLIPVQSSVYCARVNKSARQHAFPGAIYGTVERRLAYPARGRAGCSQPASVGQSFVARRRRAKKEAHALRQKSFARSPFGFLESPVSLVSALISSFQKPLRQQVHRRGCTSGMCR